jgi:predicted O-methyltransferase YrrM
MTIQTTTNINTDRSRFNFKHDWFKLIQDEWAKLTKPLLDRKLRILEIGSFEGASTTWILDNLMAHPESELTAVDSWEGGMDHLDTPTEVYDAFDEIESRFRSNVAKCAEVSKLRIMKARSDDALLTLRQEHARFDFIYIDASHIALDVLHDAVVSWRMLEEGGTLVFDDWSWKGYNEPCYNPRPAIAGFLNCVAPEIRYFATESQIWVTRTVNHTPATRNLDPSLMYEAEALSEILIVYPEKKKL